MKLLNKLERRFGRYAIDNLMKYIVILYGIGVVIETFASPLYDNFLTLDFSMVMRGQIWRLVTWIIPCTSLSNIIFTAIMVYFYYLIGNDLERAWGSFRFNLYLFSAAFFNIIASLITYLILGQSINTSLDIICGTLFFAFAAIYPNAQILMYFLIPIKAKYLAIFQGVLYLYNIYSLIRNGYLIGAIPIIVSFANFFAFFFVTRNYKRISPGEFKRKAKFRKQMNMGRNTGNATVHNGKNVITRHKCAVCGRTELDDDQLEFRFCSKCDGNYEYCMDHLFTHEHVKKH